jgi:hypothetical protein
VDHEDDDHEVGAADVQGLLAAAPHGHGHGCDQLGNRANNKVTASQFLTYEFFLNQPKYLGPCTVQRTVENSAEFSCRTQIEDKNR